jgi:hypothetical protein
MERLCSTPATSFHRRYEQQAQAATRQLVPRQDLSGMESSFLPIRARDIFARSRTTLLCPCL